MPFAPYVAWIAGALAALVFQAGCSMDATRPTVTEVRLSLAAAPDVGSPSRPVVVDVRATNVGNTRVWHCEGCGCGNGIRFSVLGPDGAEVLLSDPNGPVALCADRLAPLEPEGALGSRIVFSGRLYAPGHPTFPSPTYRARPGTYTVIASFGYGASEPGEPMGLERRTTFAWHP